MTFKEALEKANTSNHELVGKFYEVNEYIKDGQPPLILAIIPAPTACDILRYIGEYMYDSQKINEKYPKRDFKVLMVLAYEKTSTLDYCWIPL